jgi:hypothetical protein
MALDLRALDLGTLNTLTKYPSIPTFHALDPATGNLLDETVPFTGEIIGTEKVDGTNARIISLPDGTYLLGSREELLYAKGDLIGNPALGIVAELRPVAERLGAVADDAIRVHYLEVYGGKVTGASKHYTGDRRVGHRLFDVAVLADYDTLLQRPPAELSAWREAGGQTFLAEQALRAVAERDGLTLTQRLFAVDAGELPTQHDKTREFLAEHLPRTFSALDDGALGQPEGIVLRTADRASIAKARFQDYDRTLRRREHR